MDSYITWPYQIADYHCRITWVYNKWQELRELFLHSLHKSTQKYTDLIQYKYRYIVIYYVC